LEISQQGTTYLALPKFGDVQANNAVHVYVVSKLSEQLKELDVLGARLRVEHHSFCRLTLALSGRGERRRADGPLERVVRLLTAPCHVTATRDDQK
jgi:hypothetical protein